jgi:hypothetical protein
MNKQQSEKLLQLADFIEKVATMQIAPKDNPKSELEFHFNLFRQTRQGSCKTLCCAAGLLPDLFPNEISSAVDYSVSGGNYFNHQIFRIGYEKEDWHCTNSNVAAGFFGLTSLEARALFLPHYQHNLGLPNLDSNATAFAVANNIRLFVAKYIFEK